MGISNNKLLEKMASDFKKPNQVHTLFPEEIKIKMWSLPVSDLFFVGRATAKKLYHLGIFTIGDLANTRPDILKWHLKKHGILIWEFANGIDTSLVEAIPPANKGYGNSTTIPFDVTDASTAKLVLLALSETVAARLRKHSVKAELIAIGIKSHEFIYSGHQMVLKNATDITVEIHQYACRLFEELWTGEPIRHLGIRTSRIKDGIDIRQIDLFDQTDYDKLKRMDRTIDQIRHRHGMDSVQRAVFVKGPIDHMSGGVSREKRTVDYEKFKIE